MNASILTPLLVALLLGTVLAIQRIIFLFEYDSSLLPHGFRAVLAFHSKSPSNMHSRLAIRQSNHAGETISVSEADGCPAVNATVSTTATTGPNGSLFFLSCGISETNPRHGGWNPPEIQIDQVIINADFSPNLSDNDTVFSSCIPFFDTFQNESSAIGVPPIFLATFAMQESGCNPGATGSGGTAGLLQLSPDKCANVDCYDPATNIRIGARYLRTLLDANPNIVAAVGNWNGWFAGMTYDDATATQRSNCYSQQNLDYLHQYFNGWLQNINPYGHGSNDRLGYYFNLDVCDQGSSGRRSKSASWRVGELEAVIVLVVALLLP